MLIKFLIVFSLFLSVSVVFSQSKGDIPSQKSPVDTVFIFTPARPLLGDSIVVNKGVQQFLELSLSDNGYGIGYYLTKDYNSFLTFTASMFFSGARNTDEFDYYDPFTGQFFVPNKINRLFMLPITIGGRAYLFPAELSNEFKPFFQLNVGTNIILANPYRLGFIEAWDEASVYLKPVFSAGIGASFSNRIRPLELTLRYQYSPFGGEGLESILRNPISNFGGLYIALGISL